MNHKDFLLTLKWILIRLLLGLRREEEWKVVCFVVVTQPVIVVTFFGITLWFFFFFGSTVCFCVIRSSLCIYFSEAMSYMVNFVCFAFCCFC